MLWTELTSDGFAQAVEDSSGLCLLPFGCIERHGPHLPLGTDQITVDAVARQAAEEEPAVVFPSYYFGKIFTARHIPGTIALTRTLLLPLLEAVVDEIARNKSPATTSSTAPTTTRWKRGPGSAGTRCAAATSAVTPTKWKPA